ncbi:MAG: fatty acid desaturase, partial [Nitrospirales bacterium]|nr:fatty acid desaturase [Nitrospirales bacterium]
METTTKTLEHRWESIKRWFDTYAEQDSNFESDDRRIDWLRTIPFIAMHLAVLAVFLVGWSPIAVLTAAGFYVLRMFAITGFYHRYFSHKTFSTSRLLQFVFAVIGASSVQRGPLWWAAHHRNHHVNSDRPPDLHSPVQKGFLWSHMGWFLSRKNFQTNLSRIKDFARFPELRFLDRYDVVVPTLFAGSLFLAGEWLAGSYPSFGTNGWQMLVWGFVISTVVLYHCTFTITSLAHRFGSRRFATSDNSRNNFVLAMLTMGEGWHNNHHF